MNQPQPSPCAHTWERLLPIESIRDQMMYRTLLISMNHWRKNALVCTRCGKTGYTHLGKMVINTAIKHREVLVYADKLSERFGFSLPVVKGMESVNN